MDNFLYWYTNNNQSIIQALAVLIGIILIYLAYRVFLSPKNQTFGQIIPMKSSSTSDDVDQAKSEVQSSAAHEADSTLQSATAATEVAENSQAKPETTTEVKAEAAATPESQSSSPQAASEVSAEEAGQKDSEEKNAASAAEASGAAMAAPVAEIEKLKTELEKAQEKVKAKEAEISAVKEQLVEIQKDAERNAKTTTRVTIDTSTLTGDQGLIDKIDELQKKLAEYDIIADDISELQSLRKENAELKEKSASATT